MEKIQRTGLVRVRTRALGPSTRSTPLARPGTSPARFIHVSGLFIRAHALVHAHPASRPLSPCPRLPSPSPVRVRARPCSCANALPVFVPQSKPSSTAPFSAASSSSSRTFPTKPVAPVMRTDRPAKNSATDGRTPLDDAILSLSVPLSFFRLPRRLFPTAHAAKSRSDSHAETTEMLLARSRTQLQQRAWAFPHGRLSESSKQKRECVQERAKGARACDAAGHPTWLCVVC